MRYRLLALMLLPLALGADWRQFRGTDSTGHADGGAPAEFGADKNVAWKAALPGHGPSSPIVVGGRVFVTASGGPKQDRLQVLALDAKSGKQLWQRTFWATGPTDSHPKTSMAAPTPVSDGKHVVALFATGDMAALDPDGDVLWLRSLYEENPGATDGRGLASSPLLVAGTVIVQVETQNTSFAAGIDPATGKNRWRVERPREMNWTTPITIPGEDGKRLVLLQGMSRLSALDPATGKEVWSLSRSSDPIASSVLSGKVLYVPGAKGLAALELQGNAAPKLLWERAKLNPATASPVILSGRIYCLRQGGFLVAGDLKTGEVVGQLRLKGPFSASLVTAGGLLYCVNEGGQAQVVRPDDKDGQVVARGDLGETVLGTPAIVDGAIFLRGEKHLWKLAQASRRGRASSSSLPPPSPASRIHSDSTSLRNTPLATDITMLAAARTGTAQPSKLDKPPFRYVCAKAYHIPPETTTEESGYFSLCQRKNGRIYIGCAAYGRNSYLVELDPKIGSFPALGTRRNTVGFPFGLGGTGSDLPDTE